MTVEELYRELFHALDEPVEIWRGGALVARNPAAERLAFSDPAARARCLAGEPVRARGGRGWFALRAVPLQDHVAVCFRDITDLVQAEQDCRDLARLREQGPPFLHGLAHDLHGPLRTMGMYAQLLERQELPNPSDKHVATISTGVERLQRLVDDLVAYGEVSLPPLTPQPVDLHALTELVVSTLDAPDAHLRWEGLPTVLGSPALLREALSRLLDNATRYRGPRPPEVRLTATRADPCWHIDIEDNGAGMEARFLDEVFQPFKRLHGYDAQPGSGLGLAIVRRVAERHGGDVRADAIPGVGSRFRLTLPVSP